MGQSSLDSSVGKPVRVLILVNDQREHPSSSPPLYVRASPSFNLCNGLPYMAASLGWVGGGGFFHGGVSVRPGLSTYQWVDPSRSVNLCNGCPSRSVGGNLCNEAILVFSKNLHVWPPPSVDRNVSTQSCRQ